jgi:hypothetical protein
MPRSRPCSKNGQQDEIRQINHVKDSRLAGTSRLCCHGCNDPNPKKKTMAWSCHVAMDVKKQWRESPTIPMRPKSSERDQR